LKEKSVDIMNFLSDERVNMIESTLDNIQKYDTFKNYYDETNTGEMDYKRTWISGQIEITDETLICQRSVTNIQFPHNSQENILAMYSPEFGNLDSNEPNGLMILHNITKKKSELVLKHQTEFTSSCFHLGNPKLIIAGTYTGQILIYDIRAGASPILKSPNTGKYHSLPIYSINNFGMQNSNQIVSCSNDGLICTFNISNLSKALKKIEIKKSVENKFSQAVTMEEIGVISSANRIDSEYLYVGSDDSDLYQIFLGQA
jgi:dynein intermediate chain